MRVIYDNEGKTETRGKKKHTGNEEKDFQRADINLTGTGHTRTEARTRKHEQKGSIWCVSRKMRASTFTTSGRRPPRRTQGRTGTGKSSNKGLDN